MNGHLFTRFSKFYFHFKGHYRKNLIAFLLITSLPGILLGVVLFLVSKSQMEKELQTVHQNHLYKTIGSIKEQFSYVEFLLANWAADVSFSEDYEHIDVTYDYEKVRQIYKTLLYIENSNPFIGHVELFINKPHPIIFSKGGFRFIDDGDQRNSYQKFLNNDKSLFWSSTLTSVEPGYEDRYASLGLIHNLSNMSLSSYGSVLVYLNKEKLAELLKSPYEDGSVFLIGNQNQWFFANQRQKKPTKLQKEIFNEIKRRTQNIEPFVFKWDKMEYTVTYDSFSRLGDKWYYVSIAPLTTITAPVVFISKLFIILCLILLITAIILSLFASKKLYAPIETLLKKVSDRKEEAGNEFEFIESQWNHLSTETEDLKSRLERQLPDLKEGFLLQLSQGYLQSFKEKELLERMQHFGWKNDQRYLILFVQLFGFSKLQKKFLEGDEGLVTFLAGNVAKELMNKSGLAAHIINFHDLSLGLFLSFPKDQPKEEIEAKIYPLSKTMITSINEICLMDVAIGISRMTDSIKEIHPIFEETKNSLSFRKWNDQNQIIEIEKMDRLFQQQDTLDFPFDLEKEITHAIRLRNEEEAIRLLKSFFLRLSEGNVSASMMKQSALQLLGSIYQIALQASLMDENLVNKSVHLYKQLCELKDPDEMCQWFEKRVVRSIMKELSQKQDQRMRLVVENVVHIMQENYMNDISLDYCADEVNLHPSILSRVFKEISGWNFIDFLTNIRLMKAKELLIETDTKINQIAENIGYRPSYFNRLFKKNEGITPSEFRKVNRKTERSIPH
ncbi:AraC family transcriptional regulator [Lederbergia sp. NSJ-179]|uniref:helix-turn-helix transcriptional regulator n=1 Tax=Lederbergia sp. NSJ-179 TaxID=2931402 RepID=UPI001FD2D88A|nr:AraC family transcriptional regulator [Lederbergia sp. NSJ-179]MCJ7841306.1 AraC family transcriptional regulator [Lederbergia sp. NSJ-179]